MIVKECLSNIAQNVGEIHRNHLLLLDDERKLNSDQMAAIDSSIRALAHWENIYMHNMQKALE